MSRTPRYYEELRKAAREAEEAQQNIGASSDPIPDPSQTQNASSSNVTAPEEEPVRPEQVRREAPHWPEQADMVSQQAAAQEQVKENWEQRQAERDKTEGAKEMSDARRAMIEEAKSRDVPPSPDDTNGESPTQGPRR